MPREMVPYAAREDREIRTKTEVLWVRDQMVQIGVATTNGLGEGGLEKIGAAVRAELTLGDNYAKYSDTQIGTTVFNAVAEIIPGAVGSLWCDLERWQCNALVRLVRKARDQAYGKDE